MLPPNPADQLRDAPAADLVTVLLRQFVRLLEQRNITLTKAEIDQFGERAAAHEPLPDKGDAVRKCLVEFIHDSVNELRNRFDLSFKESLAADMDDIGGWETTAEFLEIANHKSNAELRISAGASLLAFFGDTRFADMLFTVIEHDAGANDVDAMFAKRALSHAAKIDTALDADDWEQHIKAALD